MGRTESCYAILGYKIKISDLVEQLNKSKQIDQIIIKFLIEGFIDYIYNENNSDLNNYYGYITDFCYEYCKKEGKEEKIDTVQKFKQELVEKLKKEYGDDKLIFYDKYLLISCETILEKTTWGCGEVYNNLSIPIQELLNEVDNLKSRYQIDSQSIEGLELVFILQQTAD